MIILVEKRLKKIFHYFLSPKIKDWLISILFLGIGLFLFSVYSGGQWKYTIQFLKSLFVDSVKF